MAHKRFSSDFKAKVALEAIQGDKTVAQLSSQYSVHATQMQQLEGAGAEASGRDLRARRESTERQDN